MRLAEGALYRAKRSGRNRCVVYSSFVDAPLSLQEEADRARTAGLANTVYALARAVDLKDGYTHQHSARVAQYAAVLAREMGMSEEEIDQIRTAGILHDVGKVGVADAVLLKPARLTDDEFPEMQRHSRSAATSSRARHARHRRMGALPARALGRPRLSGEARGRGHPARQPRPRRGGRLRGDDLIALYRRGMPVEKALTELEKSAGAQFDPQVAQRMVDLVRARRDPARRDRRPRRRHPLRLGGKLRSAAPRGGGGRAGAQRAVRLRRAAPGARAAGRQRLQRPRQLRELIAAQAAETEPVLAAHRGAPAQELLDLALVPVALALALAQPPHAQVLGEGLDRLARRRAEVVAGRLELRLSSPRP